MASKAASSVDEFSVWVTLHLAAMARLALRLTCVADRDDVDLERAIHGLAARQRLAVEFHYFLGLPVAEVASVMACSAGTVKATLSQARTRLQHQLGEDFR